MKYDYKTLKNTWVNPQGPSGHKGPSGSIESFFVGYAVNGAMTIPEYGLRAGLPANHPISGPVSEPSPLNTRWQYELPYVSISGIL